MTSEMPTPNTTEHLGWLYAGDWIAGFRYEVPPGEPANSISPRKPNPPPFEAVEAVSRLDAENEAADPPPGVADFVREHWKDETNGKDRRRAEEAKRFRRGFIARCKEQVKHDPRSCFHRPSDGADVG